MKSYNETVNNVFRRMNEYEAAQKRKRKIISKTAVSLCCACLLAVGGIVAHSQATSKSRQNVQTQSTLVNQATQSSTHTTDNAKSNLPANVPNNNDSGSPQKQVIRSYPCNEPERYVLPKNGEVLITKPLYAAMKKYGDSVLYEIEVCLLNDGKSYLNDESEWIKEYNRISKTAKDGQLGFSTYTYDDGRKGYMLLGVVDNDYIDSFPVSDRYGYYITLSGGTDECTAEEPSIAVFNGVASQN